MFTNKRAVRLLLNLPLSRTNYKIEYINQGNVKQVYALKDYNHKILMVIRVYNNCEKAIIKELWEYGESEYEIANKIREYHQFAVPLIQIHPSENIDYCEFCPNLASIIEFCEKNNYQEAIELFYQAKNSNPFTTKNKSENRDCGLIVRGNNIYVAQFDLSHIYNLDSKLMKENVQIHIDVAQLKEFPELLKYIFSYDAYNNHLIY